MKKKQSRFLSVRFFRFVIFLFAYGLFMLLALTVSIVSNIAHGAIVLVACLLFALLIYIGYRWVYLPYKETEKVFQLFVSGYTMEGIYDLRYPFSPELEKTIQKLKEFLKTNELISATKKQAQYLALQNQINPHFLYNTLEGIRGEAISAGLDNVAQMTEALATFFRYTISNAENFVTLEDEITNIENYYIIQQYRFGERLNLSIEYDCDDKEKILHYRLPKLTLQPIVENSIFHGIERKMGRGTIHIKIETTPKRLIITISDNGLGMEEARLRELNEKLNTQSMEYINPEKEKKGGIAMINVSNRIKLLFGEEYGIVLFSTQNVGTDVEITLPLLTKDEKRS